MLFPYFSQNVIMTAACSGALEMSLTVLANPGKNVLMPSPGFGVYKCLAESRGVKMKTYRLVVSISTTVAYTLHHQLISFFLLFSFPPSHPSSLPSSYPPSCLPSFPPACPPPSLPQPERAWEVDLQDMESKIDKDTAAIIVTNPSNPCGSVFSRKHLQDIIALAERHQLPIIADEIYAGMVSPHLRDLIGRLRLTMSHTCRCLMVMSFTRLPRCPRRSLYCHVVGSART